MAENSRRAPRGCAMPRLTLPSMRVSMRRNLPTAEVVAARSLSGQTTPNHSGKNTPELADSPHGPGPSPAPATPPPRAPLDDMDSPAYEGGCGQNVVVPIDAVVADNDLPLRLQWAYAIGQLGWSALSGLIGVQLVYFYLPPNKQDSDEPVIPIYVTQQTFLYIFNVITLIASAGRLWDAVTDPIIATWSDRCKHKKGRRIPFLFIGGLPAAIFCSLMFVPIVKHESPWNAVWLAFTQARGVSARVRRTLASRSFSLRASRPQSRARLTGASPRRRSSTCSLPCTARPTRPSSPRRVAAPPPPPLARTPLAHRPPPSLPFFILTLTSPPAQLGHTEQQRLNLSTWISVAFVVGTTLASGARLIGAGFGYEEYVNLQIGARRDTPRYSEIHTPRYSEILRGRPRYARLHVAGVYIVSLIALIAMYVPVYFIDEPR